MKHATIASLVLPVRNRYLQVISMKAKFHAVKTVNRITCGPFKATTRIIGWPGGRRLNEKISVPKADPEESIEVAFFVDLITERRDRLRVFLAETIRRMINRDGLPALAVRSVLSLAVVVLATSTTACLNGYGSVRKFDLGNNVSLEMVRIQGGEFLMGEDENGLAEFERECRRYDETAKCEDWASFQSPQHRVKVNEFLMGRYEVTQRQWKAVMGDLPPGMAELEAKFKGDDLPVVMVSWDEIQEFLRKIGTEYRLPSEAEWEYAARAGTTTAYAFGPEISPDIVNYNGEYPAGNQPKGLYREAPIAVGSLGRSNAWGLFDMHGNVWEWCADRWHDNYEGAPADGRVWRESGEATIRVIRGGSWGNDAVICRSAYRGWGAPGYRDYDVGFRLLRTLP